MFRSILAAGILLTPATMVHAEQSTEQKAAVNFTDHVLPIFRQHCLQCHNANDAEAGLAIDSYAALMEGGGSGDVVSAGDVSASRLYLVMTHAEEPAMPPNQDPIAKEQLEVIRKWIEGGLLENSGSKAKKRKGPSLTFASADGGKPDQIIMPESVWRVPVVTTQRAAAATALAASPWAPLAAVAGQRQVSLYDTDSGELMGIIPYPEGIPQVLRFSRDGGYLLVAGGTHASKGTASLYDVRNGERMLTVGDELDVVFGADIDDRLTRVAMGGPQKLVRIYDTSTGESVFELKKHTDWVYCVDYSPDGVLVASGDRSGGLHVWEAETGRLYLDLIGHKGAIRGLDWRPDSNVLVSASEDGTVKLWEMNEGKQLKSISAHGGGVTGVVMAKDGRIATSGKDGTVKLWKADGSEQATMPKFSEPALEAAITHDGNKLIGGDWNGRTLMWLVSDPKQVRELAANPPGLDQQKTQAVGLVAELEKALAKASAELASRKSALEEFGKTESAVSAKLEEAKQQLAKATADKMAAETLFADLKNEKLAEDKKLTVLRQTLKNLTEQAVKADQELKKQESLLSQATARRDDAAKDKQRVATELATLRARQNELKGSAVKLISDLAHAELDRLAQLQLASNSLAGAEAKLNQHAKQTTEVRAAIDATTAAMSKIQKESQEIGKKLGTLRKESANVEAKLTALKGQLSKKETELAALEKKLADASDDESRKSLEQAVSKVNAERQTVIADVKSAESTLTDRQKAIAQQQVALSGNEKQAGEAKSKLERDSNSLAKLAQTHASLQSERDQSLKARDAAAAQLATVRQQMKEAEVQKQAAVKELAPLVAKLNGLTVQEQNFNNEWKRQQAARVVAEKLVTALKAEVTKKQQGIAAAGTQQKALEGKLADLANRVGAQPALISQLAEQIKTHTAAVPKLETQLAEAKKKLGETTAAMQQAQSAADSSTAQLADARLRLKGLETELVAFQSQAKKLASELASAEALATTKRAAMEPESGVAAKLGESMASRSGQLAKIEATMKMLQEEMDALKESQSADQAKLDEVNAKLGELERAAEEAEAAAAAAKERTEFFDAAYGSDG